MIINGKKISSVGEFVVLANKYEYIITEAKFENTKFHYLEDLNFTIKLK